MFNDTINVLSGVPPMLATAWAAWFGAGLLLAMWYRKVKADVSVQPAAPSRAVARAKSGSRAVAEPKPTAVATPRPKPAPLVVGDPFGDLATLLDQPAESDAPVFRTPGDSPILNSAGSPVLRKTGLEPKY